MAIREKNTKTGIFSMLLSFTLISILSFTGCKRTEGQDIAILNAGESKINLYTPTSGGFNTVLSLYGNNLGTDFTRIRVTVNGVDAEITGSNGRVVTARVPRNAGSGVVKIFVDQKEMVFNQQFDYGFQTLVSTYLGGTNDDVKFTNAKFSGPRYLEWDNIGALYIMDDGQSSATNFASIKIAHNNNVSVMINASQTPLFERLRGMDFSANQNSLYIANDNNANGSMGLGKVTRTTGPFGNLSSISNNAGLTCVAVNPVTDEAFVGLFSGAKISRVNSNGSLTEMVSLGNRNMGISDMLFSDDGRTLYVSVAHNAHSIYKISYNTALKTLGNVEVLAGPNANTTGNAEGTGAAARFNNPSQIDLDGNGNLYVADKSNHCIRKITPQGVVTTYAGVPGSKGLQNGRTTDALFSDPSGLKFGPDNALYVADSGNKLIRRILVQ